MARPTRRHLLAAVLAAGLAACGGGGGADPSPDPGTDYLPLAAGNRWAYDDGNEATVSGPTTLDGQPWWVWIEITAGGTFGRYVRSDDAGVRFYSPGVPGFPAYTETLLRTPVTAGDRYPSLRQVASFSDVDLNGTRDDTEIRHDTEVVGFEAVVTPAGRFDGAVHLRITKIIDLVYQPEGRRETLSTATLDVWYAPGIGPVKSNESTVTSSGTETVARQVTGYRVGNRSGGTLPPR